MVIREPPDRQSRQREEERERNALDQADLDLADAQACSQVRNKDRDNSAIEIGKKRRPEQAEDQVPAVGKTRNRFVFPTSILLRRGYPDRRPSPC